MEIDQSGKLVVTTNGSVYRLGESDPVGVRTVTRDGNALHFERGVLLGPCRKTSLGHIVQHGLPLVEGSGMAIMPVPTPEDEKAWATSDITSIERG